LRNPFTVSSSRNLQHEPPQCKEYACPPSKVLADRGSYRKVSFTPASYAKLKVDGKTLQPATHELWDRLTGYFDGKNSKKEEMPRTQPTVLRMEAVDGMMFNPKNFTMFYFIDPSIPLAQAPAPMDKDIQVLGVNSYTLFIRTFSGYPVTYGDWMEQMLQLAADVEADGEMYNKNFYYFGSYDVPNSYTHRINEVQLLMSSPSAEL